LNTLTFHHIPFEANTVSSVPSSRGIITAKDTPGPDLKFKELAVTTNRSVLSDGDLIVADGELLLGIVLYSIVGVFFFVVFAGVCLMEEHTPHVPPPFAQC